jgi:integrase
MSGTVREARLGTPTARARLKAGRQPHWNAIVAGRDHLGWQRWPDDRAGRWLLRKRRGGDYTTQTIGAADDSQRADGLTILSYQQARDKAVELSSSGGDRPAGRLTVQQAMVDYVDHLSSQGKATKDAESAAVRHIMPALGGTEVAELTSAMLQRWLARVADQPPVTRTGKIPKNPKPATDDECVRRRRASANNVFSVLRAALNLAFDARRVSSNEAWGRRVKKFRGVDQPRVRYLSVDESIRLINASDPEFRPLVRAALETGCRYQEIAQLEVSDFNADAGALHVRRSKSAKARHVALTDEGAAFFSQACAGRPGRSLMFPRPSGQPWRASNQGRFIEEACRRGRIDPPITFHGLRHTWASLSIMNGVPLMVVAKNLGHADTKMVERVYGHLSQGYVFESIRAGAPRFAVGQATTVAPMSLARTPRRRKIS